VPDTAAAAAVVGLASVVSSPVAVGVGSLPRLGRGHVKLPYRALPESGRYSTQPTSTTEKQAEEILEDEEEGQVITEAVSCSRDRRRPWPQRWSPMAK